MLRVFYITELTHSFVVHTFFYQTENTVDETAATVEPMLSHLLTKRRLYRTKFCLLFYCDCRIFNLTGVFFYFSVHGDRQRNKIYLQRCSKVAYELQIFSDLFTCLLLFICLFIFLLLLIYIIISVFYKNNRINR